MPVKKGEMTEEHKQKLKDALIKANARRQELKELRAKEKEIAKIEKEKNISERKKRVEEVLKPKPQPHEPSQEDATSDDELVAVQPRKKATLIKKKQVVESSESETSSDESASDDDYVVHNGLKKYYKNKYKTKYQGAYVPPNDVLTVAKHNITSKVNNELLRLAYASVFPNG